MATKAATRLVPDLEAYKQQLNTSVYRSAFISAAVFEVARTDDRRIVFAEGEDQRVLHAVNAMIEEATARPILIGRPDVIESRCERNAIPLKVGRDFELGEPRGRPALPRILGHLPRADAAPRRDTPTRPGHHADRTRRRSAR